MKVTRVKNNSLDSKNSVFIAFYTDSYHHYQTHDECKNWGDSAWFAKIGLLAMLLRWDASFGFVGGKVDDGESLSEAAIRECKEEIGVHVTMEQLDIFCSHNMIDGDFEQNTHLFLCKVTPKEIYEIQKKSLTSEHCRIESSGFNVVHMVEDSYKNLPKQVWAGTAQQEIELLLNSDLIAKPILEKN
jgi:8-oxo-dGTP pyrophosphatase MutT (NUDIX family)